jgi:penicillin-binding protein 1C
LIDRFVKIIKWLNFILAVLVAAIFAVASYIYFAAPNLKEMVKKRVYHGVVCDRYGVPVWYLPDSKGDIGEFVSIDKVSDYLIDSLVITEDQNFYSHCGVDPFSTLRALFQNVWNGRIVSGGSTITQQVIRRIYPRKRRLFDKFRETIWALKLERILSKKEILEAYINLVPMGGNIEGVSLASRLYFEKKPQFLTLSEAASLAVLPKSPGRFLPKNRKAIKRFEKRRSWILSRLKYNRYISEREYREALAEKNVFKHFKIGLKRNHFIDMALRNRSIGKSIDGKILTTMDRKLEDGVYRILYSHRERLAKSGAKQAASIVIDAKSGDVLALAGSIKYGKNNNGFVNGALARRSMGSTLKPFLYLYAFDNEIIGPSFLFPDIKRIYKTPAGDYYPTNDSGHSYGPTLVRVALGNSLNQSAIFLLKLVGLKRFYNLLKQLGIVDKTENRCEDYGLGMAIGNVEGSLFDLASAYTVFSNGGYLLKCGIFRNRTESKKKSFF